MVDESILSKLRREYHGKIFDQILGYRKIVVDPETQVPTGANEVRTLSNADVKDPAGVDLSAEMAKIVGLKLCPKPPGGQTAGAKFTQFTCEFVEAVFNYLSHVRPGNWKFTTRSGSLGIASFEQYSHLKDLAAVVREDRALQAALGGDYFIKPDIVVIREPLSDAEIDNRQRLIQEKGMPQFTNLRAANSPWGTVLLHASISCKWTMRSDRSQNTRSEALNLIRNRKGRAPHIVAVTMEPGPARLASIVLGTGDVDCTYHGALHELVEGAKRTRHVDARTMLEVMIEGKRLKDISDLPFDLAI